MYRDLYQKVRAGYNQLSERIQKYYDEAKALTQTQFMAYLDYIKLQTDQNLVRRMREKNIPVVRDFFNTMEVKDLLKYVEAERVKVAPTLSKVEKEELAREKEFLR